MRLVGLLFGFAVAAIVVLSVSCGGDSDSKKPTPSGVPVSDVEYLRMICKGSNDFIVAINSNPDVGSIRKVVEGWKQQVEATTAPADLGEWRTTFIAYLDRVVQEPTRGLTESPPLPPDAVRQRLISHRSEVPECQNRTFLDPSPTP